MSNQKPSAQDTNIQKMNELLEEKNKKSSTTQDSTQQEQTYQSLKDSARMPDENNKLITKNNNRNA